MSSELEVFKERQQIEIESFELAQRKASAMIKGTMLPANYKNVSDVLILNEMSEKLKIPVIMLAQQLYVVKGKPTMSGQLVIAILNASKRFDSVMLWEVAAGDKWAIRAYNELNGEKIYGDWLDEEMIKANGWDSNPKWKTMRDQMARYRTASWFGRLYAPDLLMGFHETEEIIEVDIIDKEVDEEAKKINDELTADLIGKDVDITTGEVTDKENQGNLFEGEVQNES